jgi:uncharacterized protein (DUF433 family)
VAKLDLDALRRTPAYPVAEAAHYLGLPTSTLRAWCLGQTYRGRRGDVRQFRPLIQLDGKRTEGLSFLNLVEGHALAAIRRKHHIPLPKARKAINYVQKELGIDRPLASDRFITNGIDLFVNFLGELINVSHAGQTEMKDFMRAYLERVVHDRQGLPIKLYPFTRRGDVLTGKVPAPVEMDPRVAFGRPVLVGRAVPTAILADRFKAGDTISDLANDYETSTQAIEEAIRCEYDRQEAA